MLATVRRGCKGSSRLRGSDGDVSLGLGLGLDMWMCNVDGDGHGGRDVASVQAWGVSQLCEGSAHAGSGVELDANRWLGAWWWRRLTRARWLHAHVHVDAEAAGVRSRSACVEPGRPGARPVTGLGPGISCLDRQCVSARHNVRAN
jgi:hypothetical protein